MASTTYTLNGVTLTPGQPFVESGIAYPANWLALASNDDLAAHGIVKTVVPDPDPTPEEIKARLVAVADRKILALQASGVTINGVAVETTEKGLIMIGGAAQRADKDPSAVCHWTIAPGVDVDLNAETTTALGLAVSNWVDAGYVTLRAVYAAIDAGTITTAAQVEDPTTVGVMGWPAATITT